MNSLANALSKVTTITFDCYGTLIDWKAGLRSSFRKLLGAAEEPGSEIFSVYVDMEAQLEAGPFRTYRSILHETALRVASRLGVDLSPEQAGSLAATLPGWKPFPDTNAALALLKQRFRLGILSNIDGDLFGETRRHFTVDFDFVVTAQDVRSYKPGHAHFLRGLERAGGKERLLHVAQSQYHDGVPCRDLDIGYVWINRYGDRSDPNVPVLGEFGDLMSLANRICSDATAR